jgi:OFA family oxalate/formate antiporter-like MFS transporter
MELNTKKVRLKKFLIISLGIISMLAMGTIYSWSVFRTPLESLLEISALESGLPFIVFLALYAFSMPFAGKLIEKYKPSYVAIVGSIILSLGYLLSSFCTTINQLIFTYGVLGGIGVGTLYGVPVAMASRWFPRTKGIATGAILLGFGLSPLITAPLASFLIENYGVFSVFRIFGIAFLIFLPFLSVFFMNPENYTNNKPEAKVYEDNTPVTRHKSFYLLWLLFFIVTFSGLMTISITSPFSQQILHIGNTEAAILLSVLALLNGFGRLFFGFLIDKAGLRTTMFLSFTLLLISSLLIANITTGQLLQFIISMAIMWGAFGSWLTIAPVAVNRLFGELHAAKNYGKLFTAYGFGAIAGVTLAAKVKEITGSYQSVFYVVFALSILGFFIIHKLLTQKR